MLYHGKKWERAEDIMVLLADLLCFLSVIIYFGLYITEVNPKELTEFELNIIKAVGVIFCMVIPMALILYHFLAF